MQPQVITPRNVATRAAGEHQIARIGARVTAEIFFQASFQSSSGDARSSTDISKHGIQFRSDKKIEADAKHASRVGSCLALPLTSASSSARLATREQSARSSPPVMAANIDAFIIESRRITEFHDET